jgi:hypothetical protein
VHPFLALRGRLGLYLLCWVPVAGLLAMELATLGLLPMGAAVALCLFLAGLYAFICLGAWYPARALPLRAANIPQVLGMQAVGAVLSSSVWVVAGRLAAILIGRLPGSRGTEALYAPQMPVLFAVGALLYLLAVAIHYLALALDASRAAERRALELRALAREAELRALRAQIDPHFLFNSLNSVSALTASDPLAARAMCLRLADFLRATLRLGALERIPLADELSLARSFLAIEQVRFGARLQVEESVDPGAPPCLVPPLVLQPLVENAIRHGIAHLVDGGVLRLQAKLCGDRLALAIENPCDPQRPRGARSGVGLDNVRRRLSAIFGAEATVEITERDGRFRVEVGLPASLAGDESRV